MIRPAAFLFFSFLCAACFAQKKSSVIVALVDMDSVMTWMPETKEALAQLDTASARFQKQMDGLLISLSNALYPKDTLKKLTNAEYKRQVDSLQKQIIAFQKYSREEMEKKRSALYNDIRKKAKKLTVKFAKKNGFKVVLEKKNKGRAIVYNEDMEMVEITARITDQLKNVPPKKK
jgi:Skp family chaperone for outer membrane proteins